MIAQECKSPAAESDLVSFGLNGGIGKGTTTGAAALESPIDHSTPKVFLLCPLQQMQFPYVIDCALSNEQGVSMLCKYWFILPMIAFSTKGYSDGSWFGDTFAEFGTTYGSSVSEPGPTYLYGLSVGYLWNIETAKIGPSIEGFKAMGNLKESTGGDEVEVDFEAASIGRFNVSVLMNDNHSLNASIGLGLAGRSTVVEIIVNDYGLLSETWAPPFRGPRSTMRI